MHLKILKTTTHQYNFLAAVLLRQSLYLKHTVHHVKSWLSLLRLSNKEGILKGKVLRIKRPSSCLRERMGGKLWNLKICTL
jgi:hypothetical protein